MMQLKALLIKEFKEAFRDKRALMVAMSMAVMTPIVLFAMSQMALKELTTTPAIYVKFTGAENAPQLIKHLAQENIVSFDEVSDDAKAMWDQRDIKLTFPETFSKDMSEGKPVNVVLNTDFSDQSMSAPIRRIRDAVRDYAQSIGYKRLLMRGIDVKLLTPVNLVEQDTADPTSSARFITMMLGLYLLMVAFISGLSIAIDSSAGERERNVLEMLLCQPVSTTKIVMAKLICASSISGLGIILTLLLTSVSMSFVDLSQIGTSFSLGAAKVMTLLILLLPMCVLASALQLFFSFQAKTFKEAQSTVSMLIMVPTMIPLVLMFMEDKPAWLDWLPVAGQSLLMEDLFKNMPTDWFTVFVTFAGTLAFVGVIVTLLAKKLKSEKVVLALS